MRFRLSRQKRSPGPGDGASRSGTPSRMEVGQGSPPAPGRVGWLSGRARPRRAVPRQALGPFPWQQRGLRRPTAAKPRRVTYLLYYGSGRGLPETAHHHHTPRTRPSLLMPDCFLTLLRKTPTFFHLRVTACLPEILTCPKRALLPVSPLRSPLRKTPFNLHSLIIR